VELVGETGGVGRLQCASLLSEDRAKCGGSIRFVHDDLLEPGTTIAEHPHEGNEELYMILEGTGIALLDGERYPVGPGDTYICGDGHTHGIENGDAPMRMIVVCTKT